MENIEMNLQTGFSELDELTGGLNNDELIVIAGRPSMGKSVFALNLALNVSRDSFKKKVALFSLEMSKQNLFKRALCIEAEVKTKAIKTGQMPPDDWKKLINSMQMMSETNLFIDDKAGVSLAYIKEQCQRLTENNNKPDLVIIDYLQLMESENFTDRSSAIEEITKGLKNLAREMNMPVIVLSQLSRAVETREDKHPLLSDLRESPSIEANADKVIFIYREDYYDKTVDCDEAEIITAKNRNGDTGTVKLHFDKETLKFKDIERV